MLEIHVFLFESFNLESEAFVFLDEVSHEEWSGPSDVVGVLNARLVLFQLEFQLVDDASEDVALDDAAFLEGPSVGVGDAREFLPHAAGWQLSSEWRGLATGSGFDFFEIWADVFARARSGPKGFRRPVGADWDGAIISHHPRWLGVARCFLRA